MDIKRIYRRLDIEEPASIDLNIIAKYLGLSIRAEQLCACEARIVGLGDRGIITVSKDAHPLRRKFSIAHEIGHWVHHRGKALMCRAADIGADPNVARHREKIANVFAADLLMPQFMFDDHVKPKILDFKHVNKVSKEFNVSITAAARRLVEVGGYPCFLLAYGQAGWKWFARSPLVPNHWFPKREADSLSGVFDAVFSNTASTRPSKIGADAFFEGRGSERFDVLEESICIAPGEALTLVTITDKRMLE